MQKKLFKVDTLNNNERQFIIDQIAEGVSFKAIATHLLAQFDIEISDSAIKRWWHNENSSDNTSIFNTMATEENKATKDIKKKEMPSKLAEYITEAKEKIIGLSELNSSQADMRINEYLCNQIFQELAVYVLSTIRQQDQESIELEQINYLIKNLAIVSNIMQVMPSYSYKSIAGKFMSEETAAPITEEERQAKIALVQDWQRFKEDKKY